MHGAKQIRGFFQTISADLPKKAWVFFGFGFYLAVCKKTQEYGGYKGHVSLHKVEGGSVFDFLKDAECIRIHKNNQIGVNGII